MWQLVGVGAPAANRKLAGRSQEWVWSSRLAWSLFFLSCLCNCKISKNLTFYSNHCCCFICWKVTLPTVFLKGGRERGVPIDNCLNRKSFFFSPLLEIRHPGALMKTPLRTPKFSFSFSTQKRELTVLSRIRLSRCFESCQRASKLYEVMMKVELTQPHRNSPAQSWKKRLETQVQLPTEQISISYQETNRRQS